jgi:hypothetical protein
MGNDNSLDQLGCGGSAMQRYDLNLAGSAGAPRPNQVTQQSRWNGPIPPDYKAPDFSTPTLKGGDLKGTGLEVVPEFAPDPGQPDLLDVPPPSSVDMPDGMEAPPEIAQDIPDVAEIERGLSPGPGSPSLTINRDMRERDPSMSDLQHPQLRQQVYMPSNERPGELDPDALDVMHASAQYEQVRDKQYPDVQMDQYGMNNHRSRDFTLLMKGLDEQEQER